MNKFKEFFTLRRIYYLPVIILILTYPCFISAEKPVKNSSNDARFSEIIQKNREFIMVSIPDTLKVPADRARFLVSHYWDNFDFSDTMYIHLPEITEQAMVDYIQILPHTEKEIAYKSIDSTLVRAETNGQVLRHFLELYKKYLYDRSSPLKNEEFYIPVLNYTINSDYTNNTEKATARYYLKMVTRNRIGHKATDITYTKISGEKDSLYNIKSDYTVLIFYNPECHSCGVTMKRIKDSEFFNKGLQDGTIQILAFLPENDPQILEKHKEEIPDSWLNGYDEEILVLRKGLYDLRAFPEIYLLDKDKNVLLKNVKIEEVENYLTKNLLPESAE